MCSETLKIIMYGYPRWSTRMEACKVLALSTEWNGIVVANKFHQHGGNKNDQVAS